MKTEKIEFIDKFQKYLTRIFKKGRPWIDKKLEKIEKVPALGKGLREFKKTTREIKDEVDKVTEYVKSSVNNTE